jgi:hypothetical protein
MWPGLVGKGGPDAEPFIDLDTMLDLTAAANVDGATFDGVDLFPFDPHTSIDAVTTSSSDCATRWPAAASSSDRWLRLCGLRPAAARRWGATRIGDGS